MCRLLGILASETRDFGRCLKDAPRSLAALSTNHPDGWGIAVWEPTEGWLLRKRPVCAQADASFIEHAEEIRGHVLVAHVRQGTVGPVTVENTHPFQSGKWVFAHNGTIDDVEYLRSRVSLARGADIVGSTDSEILFAFLLTRFDAAGVSGQASPDAVDQAVTDAVDQLARRGSIGSYNFLLCDGETLYAQRRGRTLFLLERGHGGPQTNALVASEPITDEPLWLPVREGALVRCRRTGPLQWRTLRH